MRPAIDVGPVTVAVLARAPVPGQAKTRLIPALGGDGAARLQAWMTRRTLATALAADIGPVVLWHEGDIDPGDARVARRAQPAGDIGARMAHAVVAVGGPVVVLGTDCPLLDAATLRALAGDLSTHAASIVPAEDGGYVAIALRGAAAAVFADDAWGDSGVMARTRGRLAATGIAWREQGVVWDVDRPEDLPRLFAAFPDARLSLSAGAESVT